MDLVLARVEVDVEGGRRWVDVGVVDFREREAVLSWWGGGGVEKEDCEMWLLRVEAGWRWRILGRRGQ